MLIVCAGMDMNELVAMLRSKAKKHGAQTSHFRGVSLLKQTKKWHAQINVGGKQVFRHPHLIGYPCDLLILIKWNSAQKVRII